jgi:hypothetical protein
MISLQRLRNQKNIPSGFTGTKREVLELRLLKAKRDDKLKPLFKAAPWKPAKKHLRVESCLKCAYCESPMEAQHGDVEHFRPKSIWWWLAMCYDNYLLSCQICNQVYKGDKFPPLDATGGALGEPIVNINDSDATLKGLFGTLGPDPLAITAGRTLKTYLDDCKKEKPLLIHPGHEKPEDFIVYAVLPPAGPVKGRVMVLPRKAAHKARIVACEDCFGINREELCEQRWLRYTILEATWNAWSQVSAAQKPLLLPILAEHLLPAQPFAGMSRYYVREVWKVPGL